MHKQLLISASIVLFLLLGTFLVVLYGKGYRFGFSEGKPGVSGTGMLVATSNPDGAQVFINGHLTTATNNTLNFFPGIYDVRIFKDGYFPWEKKIKVEKEVVSKAEAMLFSTTPKLESITTTGAENPVLDPTQARIVYTVASQSARKNGIYVLDMSNRPVLILQSASTQIADNTVDTFSKASLSWSPDGKQVLATISAPLRSPTTYLLSASGMNANPQDVTETLTQLDAQWKQEEQQKERARLLGLKTGLQTMIAQNFSVMSWSTDETKILYQASRSATLPLIIIPRLIGFDATPEERSIKENHLYVYDSKEDKNYSIDVAGILNKEEAGKAGYHLESGKTLQWLPESKHLVYTHDKRIDLLEYDGKNITTIYAGPFLDSYVFPFANISKIVILTNLGNPAITANLYTIGIK